MRVLLVAPTYHYATQYPAFLSFSDFPSGFGYLASSLKQAGHKVYGCNPNNIVGYVNAWLMLQDVLSQRIKEVQPELIGLGGLCTDYKFLKDTIGIIRAIDPKLPIVLGGQIVTNDAEDVFQLLQPDYAVKGEGEQMLVRIANGFENKGQILQTPPEVLLHLDDLPFPDYEPFGIDEMLDEYSHATRVLYRYSRPDARPFNIVASRGCPFNCSFCIDHHRSYRARSIDNIMAEIQVMYERYHFNILIILDELFAINKQRMIDFCAGIQAGSMLYGWDFDWCFQTHANARLDKGSLVMAKSFGCIFFSYGLESASPVVLKSMKKRIKIEQVEQAIQMAEEVGVGFAANLIFGDVAETVETVAESLSFWFKFGVRSNVFLAMVNPYPGSELFETCRQRGMFQDKQEFYEHIDENPLNISSMTDEQFQKMLQLIRYLESCWLFVRPAKLEQVETINLNGKMRNFLGGEYYKINVACPYCGEKVEYLQLMNTKPFMLGVGCTKCHRRIKIEVGNNV